MPVTYTITASDVASADPASALTEGIIINWTDEIIHVPASVNSINPQWIVDHGQFAASTHIGIARPSILTASGKIQTGTDPDTGDPIFTSITPVLQRNWRIETLKLSGTFQITDIFNPTYTKANGVPPYIDTAGVDIRYIQTRNATIAQVSTGSGLSSAQDATLTAIANLTAKLDNMIENTGSYNRWLETSLELAGLNASEIRDAIGLSNPDLDSLLEAIRKYALAAKNQSAAGL